MLKRAAQRLGNHQQRHRHAQRCGMQRAPARQQDGDDGGHGQGTDKHVHCIHPRKIISYTQNYFLIGKFSTQEQTP
jgi:hypothetical protein